MDLSHIIGANVNCIATLEIPLAGFFACFKIEYTSTMQARNHTYGYLPAMNWMFVTPQNSYTEISIPKVRTLGGGAFGRWLGHEAGVLMNGMSARIKEAPGGSLSFPPQQDMVRRCWLWTRRAFTRIWLCCCFDLGLPAPIIVRNIFLLFISHLVCGIWL